VLENRIVVRRIAVVLAVPAAIGGLIGIAQLVAPGQQRAATQLVDTGGLPDAAASPTGTGTEPAGQDVTVASASASPSGPDAGTPTPSAATDLVVRGRYLLKGPAVVPAGGSVLFVMQGPARVVRGDREAPFAVRLDTRTIPDGAYQLVVSTVVGGRRTVDRTARLLVANHDGTAPTGSPGIPAFPGGPSQSPTVTPTPTPKTVTPAVTTTRPPTPTTTSATPKPAPTTSRPAAPSTTRTTTQAAPPPADGSFADQVVVLTNAQRTSHGCSALTVSGTLTAVALAHSQDMAAHNYFEHNSQDGRSPFDRMTAAGYAFRTAAENIAAGQRTPADVVDAWMNSAGHRANILNCALTQIGVGYATGGSFGSYWTQDFGTPR